MEIWLDTADLASIEEAKNMGILHGVTTNPSIVSKSKLSLEELLSQILQLQDGPVAAQVIAGDATGMIKQGKALFGFSNRMVVKVPVTKEGLKAIYALSKDKIPVMATAIFETNQSLLAARAGGHYIAPYFSAICDEDINGIEQLKEMLCLLERYRYPSKLIGASIKGAEQAKQCSEIGVHAVTLDAEIFHTFIEDHPETIKTSARFAKDWKNGKKVFL